MPSSNQIILDNYALYLWFLGTKKNTTSNPVLLLAKPNNTTWLNGSTDFHNPTSSTVGSFLIEQSIKNRGHFGFKIRVAFFGPDPCFRFDSDGVTHRNRLASIPLPQQQVTTPHFHWYNSDGILIAYKTAELSDANTVLQLRADIGFGLSLFCKHTILFGVGTTALTCAEQSAHLPFMAPPVDQDPLAGIGF
ncbi:MAG TPA: hypothetical protein VHH73_18780 [Verrucomicrobiae bacterium]|nr:hypothetical protein [Verrucomicrobiae bacterium]